MVPDIAWERSSEIFNEDFATVWDAQAAGFCQISYFQDIWAFGCSIV
jgi:hypothetical protein